MKKMVVLLVLLSVLLAGCGANKQENNQTDFKSEIESGIYYDGNDVHISESGVTLSDTLIEGDLYIDPSVGDGEFFLENITVTGSIYVNGGGPNSGYLINVIGPELIIESETNPNIVLSMNTQIEGVQIACDCRLEMTAENVEKVSVNNIKTKQAIDVIMKGDYPEVTLESTANVMIDGAVSLMTVLKKAEMTSIEMVDESKMYFYSCFGKSVTVFGGTIIEAWINAEYCSLPANTDTIYSDVGVAEVIVGSTTIDVPRYTSEQSSNENSEAAEPEEQAEQGEQGEQAKQAEPSIIVEEGYPTVSFSGDKITISIRVNEPCTVYALVETDSVFSKGSTPENVRDGVSAGAGTMMEDGMEYTVIHNIFNVTNLNSIQSFTINMSDYILNGEGDNSGGDNPGGDSPEPAGGNTGVFLVIENEEGNLSSLYKFQ